VTTEDMVRELQTKRLVAVIRAQSWQEAVDMAIQALDGGVEVIEVAWTTPEAERALVNLSRRVPVLGAGTILRRTDADRAVASGAAFLVGPSVSAEVADWADTQEIPYIPGVYTPADVAHAETLGCRILKLFPAGTGGMSHLKALREPFPNAVWMVTGGVTWDTAYSWIDTGAIAVGMGRALFQTVSLREATKRLAAWGQ
jgi:2-dehydro-3-deoxyphosphogluconate aldolase/(4S)-4-hydroxy-2-oxoglutarate aldolase